MISGWLVRARGLNAAIVQAEPRFSDVGEDLVDDGRVGNVSDHKQGCAAQWTFRDIVSSRSELLS